MVYQGKPSAGCANCRKRKIKCDEGTPACSQCLNTKRECPGYVPRFDLVLRDQTKAVRRKAQKRKQSGNAVPKKDSPPFDVSPTSDSSMQMSSPFAAAGPSGARALGKRSNSDQDVPRMINDFPEQQAICAFFLDFVLLPRHPDSVRGHLEHLYPLYQKAAPESPLSLATSSVALAISGGSPSRRADQQLSRTIFGKALQKTSASIRDPIDSIKDETLMAVLLLGLYERITSTNSPNKNNMASTHNAGAAALVKHRGRANCTSPLAIGLLFAVRTQLVEHAIECAQGFKRCPDSLSAIFRELPQNASARLTSATINIADLRACAKTALSLPRSPASEKEVNDLLEYAISIDLLVAAWPESVPETWSWKAADSFDIPPPPIPKAAFVYTVNEPPPSFVSSPLESSETLPARGPDVYLDLWVLSIWNQYRAARIKIQRIILDCIAYLGPTYDSQWYWRAVYATMTTQEMADDISHSVPFALGTKTFGGGLADSPNVYRHQHQQNPHQQPLRGEHIEFPYVAAQGKQPLEHARAASAMGGWHLLDPLKACLLDTGSCLREGQKGWLAGQMERIGRIYGLHGREGDMSIPSWEPQPPALMQQQQQREELHEQKREHEQFMETIQQSIEQPDELQQLQQQQQQASNLPPTTTSSISMGTAAVTGRTMASTAPPLSAVAAGKLPETMQLPVSGPEQYGTWTPSQQQQHTWSPQPQPHLLQHQSIDQMQTYGAQPQQQDFHTQPPVMQPQSQQQQQQLLQPDPTQSLTGGVYDRFSWEFPV